MKITPQTNESLIKNNFEPTSDIKIMNKLLENGPNKSAELVPSSFNKNSLGAIDFQAVFSGNNSQFMPKCPLCEKTFANSSNLKHHMNTIHFNEAKWICNECGKVCTSKSNLKVHLRVHLRVKPYYCRWCDYNCMHHSSIRDHLSKCHPDRSHNSCEPGYIFNSTAVPEPELSHFEPSTNLLTCALSNSDQDDSTKGRKSTYYKQQLNKRGPEADSDDHSLGYMNNLSSEDLSNSIKKFKQNYELNKLKKANSKKLKAMNNKYRGTLNDDNSFHPLQQTDPFYNSEDEHNTSLDDPANKHSSPSNSISSSADSQCTSSTSSKHYPIHNPLQGLQFLAQHQNQKNDLFANLLSSLPNNLQDAGTGSLNNLAVTFIQRLSTVALLQQFSSSNNMNNNSHQNNNALTSLESRSSEIDLAFEDDDDSNSEDPLPQTEQANDRQPQQILDLSMRVKKETSDSEYYTALSPVSTSSTNLSTTSSHLSSISKLKNNNTSTKTSSDNPGPSTTKKTNILNVIDRLKSAQKPPSIVNSVCPEHVGLDELNDLIKTHLLPISEAVFEKYKAFFSSKNGIEPATTTTEDEEKTRCTFCNIFKNLIELHELLHNV